jgi:rubrerythrin
MMATATPCWDPFDVAAPDANPEAPRSIHHLDGVGDRLRSAAFAEIQAREAFRWAAKTFADASEDLRGAWENLATSEERHLEWLLKRMEELGVDVRARKVSDHLWRSFMSCKRAEEFAIFMANAEERGQKAGMRFYETLLAKDPITARIFGKIAEEETSHIALAKKFFPTPI